jgi:hypothetical protein
MSLVVLLSGPNLNLLGEREPAIYGTETLAAHVARAELAAAQFGLTLEHVQTNHEGELVDAVHRAPPLSSISRIRPRASRSGTRRCWRQWPPASLPDSVVSVTNSLSTPSRSS